MLTSSFDDASQYVSEIQLTDLFYFTGPSSKSRQTVASYEEHVVHVTVVFVSIAGALFADGLRNREVEVFSFGAFL